MDLAKLAFVFYVFYITGFLFFNFLRGMKPHNNELLYNPVRWITEFIKDIRE